MIGPLMLDLDSLAISEDEKTLLENPYVGGVILFARNVDSPEQVAELTNAIRDINPNLLIAVDQEGGRVARLREGFTPIPPMRVFGKLYDQDPEKARMLTEVCGWLMATEVLSVGVDFSFAPVLDLDYGVSDIIGDRAFHSDPHIVADLAQLFIHGMLKAGMQSTGKHFPGHGFVAPDSHLEIPTDDRDLSQIEGRDMMPFEILASTGMAAVMPAHIIYARVDDKPAGFSKHWLQNILRGQLDFQGVIFSDDLTMEGASAVGDFKARAKCALDAGCDMILVCNHRQAALDVLDYLPEIIDLEKPNLRLDKMRGVPKFSFDVMHENPNWQQARDMIVALSHPQA